MPTRDDRTTNVKSDIDRPWIACGCCRGLLSQNASVHRCGGFNYRRSVVAGMPRRWRTLTAIAFLVLAALAGCSTTHTAHSRSTMPSTSTTNATPTHATSSTPRPSSPFGSGPVTVSLVDDAGTNRSYRPLVRRALHYWNTNGSRYGNYTAHYVYTASSPADIRIRLQSNITRCNGYDTAAIGCAPVLHAGQPVQTPVRVRIETGWSNRTTIRTIRHELGHTRGLHHNVSPMPLMRPVDRNASTRPKPNVSRRLDPWHNRTTLTVALTGDGVGTLSRRNVEHALSYYEAGADGWVPRGEHHDFRLIRNASRADVTIRIGPAPMQYQFHGSKTLDSGSRLTKWGDDPDDDGELEYYRNATILVAGVSGTHIAWHVGYQLAYLYGGTKTPRPRAFREGASRTAAYWR